MRIRSHCVSSFVFAVLAACGASDPKESVASDMCPEDANKTQAGVCGCGLSDADANGNGVPDCLDSGIDLCPDDSAKTVPGVCGCGVADADASGNGVPDCLDSAVDLCPDDANKTQAGVCGCGVADADASGNGVPDCFDTVIDLCPNDSAKTVPGVCGCGVADADASGNGVPDCLDSGIDYCPADDDKQFPGTCDCGISDDDTNDNGVPDCLDDDIVDLCPADSDKVVPGACGCGIPDTDVDGDGAVCDDACPYDSRKTAPGDCGCGNSDTDDDNDGHLCDDQCPNDPQKSAPGGCGCGVPETDADFDLVVDCLDGCPSDPTTADDCDTDQDGVIDSEDPCPRVPGLCIELPLLGKPSPSLDSSACASGEVMVGLRYYRKDDNSIWYLQAACRAGNPTGESNATALSGSLSPLGVKVETSTCEMFGDCPQSGGVPDNWDVQDSSNGNFLRCDQNVADGVVVGQRISVFSSDTATYITSVSLVCRSISTGGVFRVGAEYAGPTTDVLTYEDSCAPGLYVNALELSGYDRVELLRLRCQPEYCPGDPSTASAVDTYPEVNSDNGSGPEDLEIDCREQCDFDPNKLWAGSCGCGVSDADSDGDGLENCHDSEVGYTPFTQLPDRGSAGSSYFTGACQSGYVAVGVRYGKVSGGPFVGKIQVLCRERTGASLGVGTAVVGPIGPSDGWGDTDATSGRPGAYDPATSTGPFYRCDDNAHPDGVAVGQRVWIVLRDGDNEPKPSDIGLVCQSLAGGNMWSVGPDKDGPARVSSAVTNHDICDGQPLVGLAGHFGMYADSFSFVCGS